MSTKVGKILAVDDNEDILFALKLLLKQHVEIITTINDPGQIPGTLADEDYDVILLDMNFTKDAISGQEYMDPPEVFYHPKASGLEAKIRERLEYWRKLKKERQKSS